MRLFEMLFHKHENGGFKVLGRSRVNECFWFRIFLRNGDVNVILEHSEPDREEMIEQKFAVAAGWADCPVPVQEGK